MGEATVRFPSEVCVSPTKSCSFLLFSGHLVERLSGKLLGTPRGRCDSPQRLQRPPNGFVNCLMGMPLLQPNERERNDYLTERAVDLRKMTLLGCQKEWATNQSELLMLLSQIYQKDCFSFPGFCSVCCFVLFFLWGCVALFWFVWVLFSQEGIISSSFPWNRYWDQLLSGIATSNVPYFDFSLVDDSCQTHMVFKPCYYVATVLGNCSGLSFAHPEGTVIKTGPCC